MRSDQMMKPSIRRDDGVVDGRELVTYDAEAIDGRVGKVDERSLDLDGSHVVVDTGRWIFGKKRLVPVSSIGGVDHEQQTVYLELTKDQVKHTPALDERQFRDSGAADQTGPYGW